MSHWPFIVAAYALSALGTFGLSLASWQAMRTAERRADDIGKTGSRWR